MTPPVILWSIAIGVAVGSAIVILIQLQRRTKVINSMPSMANAVGRWAIVEVPFNAGSRGKIRITLKGSTIDLAAITDTERTLNVGDRVFIVAVQGNRVMVVPEEHMQS